MGERGAQEFAMVGHRVNVRKHRASAYIRGTLVPEASSTAVSRSCNSQGQPISSKSPLEWYILYTRTKCDTVPAELNAKTLIDFIGGRP